MQGPNDLPGGFMPDFEPEFDLSGSGMLTTEICFYMPDHPSLLQTFVWQTVDRAPQFPALAKFLDHWRREVEAAIHSIHISHSDWEGPKDLRPAQFEGLLN